MAKSKKRDLNPKESYASESLAQMNIQRSRMGAQEFRDALTKAKGSVVGVKTETLQANRWSV